MRKLIVILFMIFSLPRSCPATNVRELVMDARKHYEACDYRKALGMFIEGLRISSQEKDTVSYMRCLGYIGNIYNCYNDYGRGIGYTLKGYDVAVEYGDKEFQANFLSNIVGTYCRLGNVSMAKTYYRLQEKTPHENNAKNRYYLLYNKGRIYGAENRPDKALDVYREIMEYIDGEKLPGEYRLIMLTEIGIQYLNMGDYKKALEYGHKSTELAKKIGNEELRVNSYRIIADAYRGLNMPAESETYRNLFYAGSDSLINPRDFYAACSQLKNYEDSVTGGKITHLEGTVSRQHNIIVMVVFMLVVVTFSALVIYLFYRRQRTMQKLLVKKDIENDELYNKAQNAVCVDEKKPETHEEMKPQEETPRVETDGDTKNAPAMSRELTASLRKAIVAQLENVDVISDPDFSLGMLAENIGSNMKYVSTVVNTSFGKNFKTLLNEYRIREACRRLRDREHYSNITIMGIYESLGYRNASTFIRCFKQIVGMSPSVYQKLAANGLNDKDSPDEQ